jgi:hypothetical protein
MFQELDSACLQINKRGKRGKKAYLMVLLVELVSDLDLCPEYSTRGPTDRCPVFLSPLSLLEGRNRIHHSKHCFIIL